MFVFALVLLSYILYNIIFIYYILDMKIMHEINIDIIQQETRLRHIEITCKQCMQRRQKRDTIHGGQE